MALDRELAAARRELHHVSYDDPSRELRSQVDSILEALESIDDADAEPKPDRVEELRAELSRLEDDTDNELAARLRRARRHLRSVERDAGS